MRGLRGISSQMASLLPFKMGREMVVALMHPFGRTFHVRDHDDELISSHCSCGAGHRWARDDNTLARSCRMDDLWDPYEPITRAARLGASR